VSPSVELLGLMKQNPQFLTPDPRPTQFSNQIDVTAWYRCTFVS